MKPLHFLPPAIALVIAGLWVDSQRRSIATLDEQSDLLAKHIAAARATEASSHGESGVAGSTAGDKKPINWKHAASLVAEMRHGGIGDNRAMMRFERQLMALTPDELSAALQEIQTLGLPGETRTMLESSLLNRLFEKDSEMALKRFFNRWDDQQGMIGWQLSRALATWIKKDVAGVTTWLDQQIAAGAFDSKALDGKNRTRMRFEGTLLGALLSSDPEAAARRLENLPQNQRKEILAEMRHEEIKEKDQMAFAKLVRQQLSEKDQAEAIAQVAQVNSPDAYSKVTDYLQRIGASPAERVACIDAAANSSFRMISNQRKITAEDVDKLRAWASSEAPEAVDRATGNDLASATYWNNQKFSDLADLAEQYHQAGGGDEVIIPLLRRWSGGNKERARKLAERISNEKRRNDFLQELN
jgi:ABC-type transporter MlaC component